MNSHVSLFPFVPDTVAATSIDTSSTDFEDGKLFVAPITKQASASA